MIHLRPGSPAFRLIELIASCGEFPLSSLGLLGDERWYRDCVRRLTEPDLIRLSHTDILCAPLILNGKGKTKSVRLRKSAFPILESIGGMDYYLHAYWHQKFPGDAAHRERNFRVGEAMAMCMAAGIEFRPYRLPKLTTAGKGTPGKEPLFYPSRLLKVGGGNDIRKTGFTRIAGAIFCGTEVFAVYNARNAVMKWQGAGEFKARESLSMLARMNAGIPAAESCILFGASEEVAQKTVLPADDRRSPDFRFSSVYPRAHFVPANRDGVRLLRLMTVPGWRETILDLLFEPRTRTYDRGAFQYDAKVDGVCIHSHLDADLSRLIRFRDAICYYQGPFEVICYPFQTDFLKRLFGDRVRLTQVEMRLVEKEFETERGDLS